MTEFCRYNLGSIFTLEGYCKHPLVKSALSCSDTEQGFLNLGKLLNGGFKFVYQFNPERLKLPLCVDCKRNHACMGRNENISTLAKLLSEQFRKDNPDIK